MSAILLYLIFNGIIWGLVIALLAIGLNLVYGLLGIVNTAQGAFYMLGAVTCWLVAEYSGSYLLAVLVALLVGLFSGIVVERFLLRSIEKNHDLTIIMTIGLMMVMEELAHWWIGADIRTVRGFLQGEMIQIFGFGYPLSRIVVAGIAIAVLVALWLFIRATRFGLWMRAARHDPDTAYALGVPINRVFMWTFGLGTALASLGGALVAQIVSIRPEMGMDILVIVFAIVIVGGLGNLQGVVVVAIAMAVTEGLAASVVSPAQARVIALLLLCLLLVFRPDGLFSRRNARQA
jgi:branched-chain amino acid transport system permease protein